VGGHGLSGGSPKTLALAPDTLTAVRSWQTQLKRKRVLIVNIENQKNPAIKKFSRALLATTCLAGVSGIASGSAITITEGTPPAPIDFGNSFNLATVLPTGTTIVNGTLTFGSDSDDYFEFQNLPGNGTFSVTAVYAPLGQEAGMSVTLVNSANALLGFGTLESSGAILQGTVPGDGNLIVDIGYNNRFGPNIDGEGVNSPNGYQVTLTTTPTTPEPATLALTGLALAGALAWRRKRSSQP
jgi:hypothetical protein